MDFRRALREVFGGGSDISVSNRLPVDVQGSLLVAKDSVGSGYCEICNAIPVKGELYVMVAPAGKIYALDPVSGQKRLAYQHPYVTPDKWRMTCWGSQVTDEDEAWLLYAGWAADSSGDYRPAFLKTKDGVNWSYSAPLNIYGEAYEVFEFRHNGTKELYFFVADFDNDDTVVLKGATLQGPPWTEVYRFDKNYKVRGATSWFGHLWAVGTREEPGMRSDDGVIIHYNPGVGWENFQVGVGLSGIALVFTGNGKQLLIGDTNGRVYLTFSMPVSLENRILQLDAPVLGIFNLRVWEVKTSPTVVVNTGLREGWGSLYLLDSLVYPRRIAHVAPGGIPCVSPYRGGLAYGTAWDIPGWEYNVIDQKWGGKGNQTAAVRFVSPEAAAEASGVGNIRYSVWEETVIVGGASEIIPTFGHGRVRVNFATDTAGGFKVEFDYGATPEHNHWVEREIVAMGVGDAVERTYPVEGSRMRVSFDQAATVSLVAYLED